MESERDDVAAGEPHRPSGDLRSMWPRPQARENEAVHIDGVRNFLDEAETKINAGNAAAAANDLRLALKYPSEINDFADVFAHALSLISRIKQQFIANEDKLHVAQQAAEMPDSPGALYHLAYQLVETGDNGAAATVFSRALTLAPENATLVEELVSSLERDSNYEAALPYLRSRLDQVEGNFYLAYQLAWLSILCGDLEPARRLHPFLSRERGDDAGRTFLESRISAVLQRADAVKDVSTLDKRDLRGWNYVLNGGILLHVSPDGFDEGMNGRYSWVHDSDELCLEGIRRLACILKQQDIVVPRIIAMSDQKSFILGKALATILGCQEIIMWPWEGTNLPGIVVAYDLDLMTDEINYPLRHRHPGQYLWAHAMCWTSPEPCVPAPDFVTFLYQTRLFPWIARCKVGEEAQAQWDAQRDESQTAHASTMYALAARLVKADVPLDGLDGMDHILAISRASGLGREMDGDEAAKQLDTRQMQWPRSPVPGNIWTATTTDVGVAGNSW